MTYSVLLSTLTGCGTGSYGEAVKSSKPELELRSKFASLGLEYYRFPVEKDARGKSVEIPIAFRVPRMFLLDDTGQPPRWKTYDGKAVKLNSRDPFEVKGNQDFKGAIQAAYAIPRNSWILRLSKLIKEHSSRNIESTSRIRQALAARLSFSKI